MHTTCPPRDSQFPVYPPEAPDQKITNKDYEDEWNYDQQELNDLQIKIEKQQVESLKVFDVMAFGILGFTKNTK